MNKIEFLSTTELERFARRYEKPKTLEESMIQRGILAELESRNSKVERLIEELKSELEVAAVDIEAADKTADEAIAKCFKLKDELDSKFEQIEVLTKERDALEKELEERRVAVQQA